MRIWEGLRAGLMMTAPIGLLLVVTAGLLPDGTWLWGRALWFIGVYGAICVGSNVALAVVRPAQFRVRQQGVVARQGRRQPLMDAVGTSILAAYGFAWIAFIPLDVFRLHLLPAPGPLASAIGGVCVVVGALLTPLAVWQNEFATPHLDDQADLRQRVIDTGIYGVIRHPIYAGTLLLFGGLPVWLGSWAGFIGAGVLLPATIGRILMEEGQLRASLPAYADYARRVRSRLIPYVL
jgi:protein-S-isoprenylcysteine O-methyltransferase Ste14